MEDLRVCCLLIICGSYAKSRRLLAALREPWIIAAGFCPNSPAKQGIEVPFLRVKGLVFHASKSKADGQHGEGEDEEAGDPKHSSPGIKPAHGGEKGTSDFRVSEGTFAHLGSDPKWEEGSSVAE